MIPFQGGSCYWKEILLLLSLNPVITKITQWHLMHLDRYAFYLVNDLHAPPTDRRYALQKYADTQDTRLDSPWPCG